MRRLSGLRQWSFLVLMLLLTGLFVMLGVWQMQRLSEKEAQIALVAARVHAAPVALPGVSEWSALEVDAWDYRPVTVSGTFDYASTVLVFDNLITPHGLHKGVGYWVMAPLVTEDGGTIWVNRGFVPEHLAEEFAAGGPHIDGRVAVEGLARRPERENSFTPEPNLEARRDWLRNPERLSVFLPAGSAVVAPLVIDLPAGEWGALPQGGETQLSFPNRHIEYAGTWFVFALITPIMLGFWLFRQRKTANLAEPADED